MKRQMIFLLAFAMLSSFMLMENEKPTLYVIGDSTVRNTNRPQCGWAEKLAGFFDTSKLAISNQAMAGRSTRTFIKEKRWEKVMSTIKKGDYIIMQFGHNEGSRPDTTRSGYRGVLKGTGNESVQLTWPDGTPETVYTYGAYLRRFVQDAKGKGAVPIIASMIPRNQFKDGKVKRANEDYGKWAREVAESEGVVFIDLNSITADKYDLLGAEKVAELFSNDHTHTNEAGAVINAASVTEGIRLMKDPGLKKYLLSKN